MPRPTCQGCGARQDQLHSFDCPTCEEPIASFTVHVDPALEGDQAVFVTKDARGRILDWGALRCCEPEVVRVEPEANPQEQIEIASLTVHADHAAFQQAKAEHYMRCDDHKVARVKTLAEAAAGLRPSETPFMLAARQQGKSEYIRKRMEEFWAACPKLAIHDEIEEHPTSDATPRGLLCVSPMDGRLGNRWMP